jgi:hypothetical protein
MTDEFWMHASIVFVFLASVGLAVAWHPAFIVVAVIYAIGMLPVLAF